MYELYKLTCLHDENRTSEREVVRFSKSYRARFSNEVLHRKMEIFTPTFEQNVTAGLNPLVHVNPNKIYTNPIE